MAVRTLLAVAAVLTLAACGTARTPDPAPAPTAVSPDVLIAHQQGAIALARTELSNGRNRDALAFARQVDESRTAEIQQLTAYRG